MPKKNPTISSEQKRNESRVLPLFIAGLICFSIATVLGFGAWSLFGSNAGENNSLSSILNSLGTTSTTPNPEVKVDKTPDIKKSIPVEQEVQISKEIKGIVDVSGGEFAIGGGDSQNPIERVFIDDFAIAETEVTNEQYAEFVKETGHRSPVGWNADQFPKGEEKFPVTSVSFSDAQEYCKWLSEKYDLEVRLPTEAEWELAAGGMKKFKYPWGNDWNDEAVESKLNKGKLKEVKSLELNKSPFGAFDMVGNVWEWTAEKITLDEVNLDDAKEAIEDGKKIRIAKGGSYIDKPEYLTVSNRSEIPQTTRSNILGFRYVILKGKSIRNNESK